MTLQASHLSARLSLKFGSMASPTFHRGSRGGNPSEPACSCCLSPEGKDSPSLLCAWNSCSNPKPLVVVVVVVVAVIVNKNVEDN